MPRVSLLRRLKLAKTVVWVTKRPFHARDVGRLGVGTALDVGYRCIFIDGSNALHPEAVNPPPHPLDHPDLEVRRPSSGRALVGEINSLGAVDLVIPTTATMGLSPRYVAAMRAVSRLDAPYLVIAPYPIPVHAPPGTTRPRIGRLRDRLRAFDPANSLIGRLPHGWLGVRQADYALYSCTLSAELRNNLVGATTVPIYSHSPDYDELLSSGAMDLPVRDQAVFIDQYMPFHPDALRKGTGHLDPQEYYGQLNRVFERFEREYGMEVVIAAHPRADYAEKPWCFPGRRIETGRTIATIAESRHVFGHYSVALSMAISLRKPITLLSSTALLAHHVSAPTYYWGYATELRLPLGMMDGDIDAIDFGHADNGPGPRFEEYEQRYLRHPLSSGSPLWSTVFSRILGEN